MKYWRCVCGFECADDHPKRDKILLFHWGLKEYPQTVIYREEIECPILRDESTTDIQLCTLIER